MGLLADHLAFVGKEQRSLALRRQLVELVPGDATAWSSLASALTDLDSEQALKAAKRAYELNPGNPRVLDTLGWTFTQLGQLDKGLAYLREALSRDADNPTTRYHLGVALQEYGNVSAARRELQRALDLSPSFAEREDAAARLNALSAR
jgi:tetratricopeptide (TPR) repeat protein